MHFKFETIPTHRKKPMTVERVIQGSRQEAHDETVTVEHNRRITVDSVALMDGS